MGTAALILGSVVLCSLAGLGVALLLFTFTGPDWGDE